MSNQAHPINDKAALAVGCTLARAALAAFEQITAKKSRPSFYELLDSEENELKDNERLLVICERLRQLLVRSQPTELSEEESELLRECLQSAQNRANEKARLQS